VNATVPSGYCAKKWFTGLAGPRGIITLSNNDVLAVEGQASSISLFYTNTTTGLVQKVNMTYLPGLNHGITFGGGYLYASTSSTVYRWFFIVGSRAPLGRPQVAITSIPSLGELTRTLLYSNGSLIVQVGSNGNIDTSGQGGIYRFPVTNFPTTFPTRAVVASGLRNSVGIKYDLQGKLWGVDNGIDELNRTDLGVDIHNSNPGEELNLFDQQGKFYGYPYCWAQYNLSSVTTPRGTLYAIDKFMRDGTHTDAWCQNLTNAIPPKYQLPPHTAPLDIIFYNGSTFPGMHGDAFVSLHGSFDSVIPVGYSISHIKFSGGLPVSDDTFFGFKGPGATGAGWPFRPVGLTWAKCDKEDCLLATDDANGTIISITYTSTCNCIPDISTTGKSSDATPSSRPFFLVSLLFIFVVVVFLV